MFPTDEELAALTDTQLLDLEARAAFTRASREANRDKSEEELRVALGSVVTELDQLIGPDAPTVKSAATLTQANLYTAPELAAATGIAHDAQLAWMLTIARTVRNLARVVSGTID